MKGMLDTEKFTAMEQEYELDPALQHLQGSEEATPEEENAMAEALNIIADYLYSEEGTAKVAQRLKTKDAPLHDKVGQIAVPLLTKAAQELAAEGRGDLVSSIMFGEEGLISQVNDMILDLADAAGLKEANDPDEYAASLINLYKLAGEHVLESGDEAAISDAKSLAEDMVLTSPDGSMMDRDKFAKQALERDPIAAGIKEGLGI